MPDKAFEAGTSDSAIDFLLNLVFNWVPGAVVSLFEAGKDTAASTSSPPALDLISPVRAPDFFSVLEGASTPGGYDALINTWHTYVLLSIAVSAPFLAVALYALIRVPMIRRKEREAVEAAQRTVVAGDMPKTHLRWNRILEQSRGEDEHNWRLAILEADIMLNELLDALGYKGETIADKMKQVDRANFNSIDAAWEAHKFRNRIAHSSAEQSLSARDVRRALALYESVFREFRVIE